MSARRIDELMPANMVEAVVIDHSDLTQINQETRQNLEGLEREVKDAKMLVRQTQSKVDELASSIEEIENPQEKKPALQSNNDPQEPEPESADQQ